MIPRPFWLFPGDSWVDLPHVYNISALKVLLFHDCQHFFCQLAISSPFSLRISPRRVTFLQRPWPGVWLCWPGSQPYQYCSTTIQIPLIYRQISQIPQFKSFFPLSPSFTSEVVVSIWRTSWHKLICLNSTTWEWNTSHLIIQPSNFLSSLNTQKTSSLTSSPMWK